MEIVFILVQPAVPENIGAAARALNTMGFNQLRLVSPKNFPSDKAYWLAHGSSEILDQARVFNSFKDAVSDIDFLIATSANKSRAAKVDLIPASEVEQFIQEKGASIQRTGIVFGSEESGLSNEQIRKCHVQSYIPLAKSFPSLNLSQAVMIYAYELSGIADSETTSLSPSVDRSEFAILMDKMEGLLDNLDIKKDSNLRGRIRERLSLAGQTDVHLILSVLNRLMNKK